jgi:peptidoglycan hydrolase-like protein with peptidoglycan-binding domain
MTTEVARLNSESTAHDTVNTRTVEIYFHQSPGWPDGDNRGIEGMEYQVLSEGSVTQSGRTGRDGKIEMSIRGNESTLQLMFNGASVAEYRIAIRDEDWEAPTTIIGVQRRLRALGYHLGHTGDESDGIDGDLRDKTDKAILDFQIDSNLTSDGEVGNQTRNSLNNAVGGSAGGT